MQSHNSLKSVAKLVTFEYDKAIQNLRLLFEQYTQEKQKLSLLQNYHDEYRNQWPTIAMNINQIKQMQSFLDNLHVSIFEQSRKLKKITEQLEASQRQVKTLMQRKKGLDLILEKRAALEKEAAYKKELDQIQESILAAHMRSKNSKFP